jgi:hypothetical protein
MGKDSFKTKEQACALIRVDEEKMIEGFVQSSNKILI